MCLKTYQQIQWKYLLQECVDSADKAKAGQYKWRRLGHADTAVAA
jgi:hypothetical protein|tara:strand:+ start:293 stop:427 length:135 start_codon:yes stop_codon:yes gene_type:complete